MSEEKNIVIAGGGLVGLLAAILLAQNSISIHVLEKNTEVDIYENLAKINRPISLNYRSYLLIKQIGIWENLKSSAQEITSVHVSEQGAFGALRFSAQQSHIPVLGYVVSYKELYEALLTKCQEQCQIEFDCEVQEISQKDDLNTMLCSHNRDYSASLLLAADGIHSKVRSLLEIETECVDQAKVAIPGSVTSSYGIPGMAYQRFTKRGIFAFLPGNLDSYRLVWTMTDKQWQIVSQYDNVELCGVMEEVMGSRLGTVTSVNLTKPMSLQRVTAAEQVAQRAVLLGNAAHTIYPIAAQGFNYSLQEVVLLQQVLQYQQDYGAEVVLQRFNIAAQKRRKELYKILNAIDYFFDYQLPGSSVLRGKLLAIFDYFPGKSALAKRFLGLSACDNQLIQ